MSKGTVEMRTGRARRSVERGREFHVEIATQLDRAVVGVGEDRGRRDESPKQGAVPA